METEAVLVRNVYIAVPAEEVWPWLVEPARTREYSLCCLAEAPGGVGQPISYLSNLGGQVVIQGVIEELVPGRKLVHTYQFLEEDPEPPSRVAWELMRYGDEMCCLQLRHEGMVPRGSTLQSVSTSWDVILCSLKTLVETGRSLPWPRRKHASRG